MELEPDRPLAGVRVVDAAAFITGPYAAMMLGDLGADVIKVEPPLGDPFRRFGKRHEGVGLSFVNINHNKRSVALDLHDPAEAAAFRRLVGQADVLFTNWRTKTTTAMGLDDLAEANPRLVWVRITGFGPDGPLADAPAFDSVIQARTGLAMTQGAGGRPELVQSWICDKVTSVYAAQAALAALVGRDRTGRGTAIELPMLDVMSYFDFPDLMVERTLLSGEQGPSLNAQISANRPVATADGWILVSPVAGRQIARALAALGAPERQDELRACQGPVELAHAFFAIAEELTPKATTEVWLERFAAHDVPAAPVFDLDAHLADEQTVHNGMYASAQDPRLGSIRRVRYPGWFDGQEVSPFRPAPALDEHRDEVLGAWTASPAAG